MPVLEDVLSPIPGPNPSGENLRYAPVCDKIREARREDDDDPQGEWQRERKKADYALVLKLSTEALASKSKDLQLAAWMTEALLKQDGFSGLQRGLSTIHGLIENFWDTLYPPLEDGEAELRATPLEWIGRHCADMVRALPLTRSGLDWIQYKISRTVGYEQAANTEEKRKARALALKDGKISAEEFDAAVSGTPKDFYLRLLQSIDDALSTLGSLNELCQEKFGEFWPSFVPLREAMEEVRVAGNLFLQKRREQEPDVVEVPVEPTPEPAAVNEPVPPPQPIAPARQDTPLPAPTVPAPAQSGEPTTRDEAYARVIEAARYLRKEDPADPIPYLLLRALRWGELRQAGETPPTSLLEAPDTAMRKRIRALADENAWTQMLDAVEETMGTPAGRAWMDLQRHAIRACGQLGYQRVEAALRSELKCLLADFVDLPARALNDETPSAGPETQNWLKELCPPEVEQVAENRSTVHPTAPEPVRAVETSQDEVEAAVEPDAYELACEAAHEGRVADAVEMLSARAVSEASGRDRFRRRLQLAQLCVEFGCEGVAYPILAELADEIRARRLEEWEPREMVAGALSLLFRCMNGRKDEGDQRERLYARICQLDPGQALRLAR